MTVEFALKARASAQPPLRFDGYFGTTAAIAEMLLQSHVAEPRAPNSEMRIIHLLPALPKTWANGSVKGLRTRGGVEVDLAWADGKLPQATFRSTTGSQFKALCAEATREFNMAKGTSATWDGR